MNSHVRETALHSFFACYLIETRINIEKWLLIIVIAHVEAVRSLGGDSRTLIGCATSQIIWKSIWTCIASLHAMAVKLLCHLMSTQGGICKVNSINLLSLPLPPTMMEQCFERDFMKIA